MAMFHSFLYVFQRVYPCSIAMLVFPLKMVIFHSFLYVFQVNHGMFTTINWSFISAGAGAEPGGAPRGDARRKNGEKSDDLMTKKVIYPLENIQNHYKWRY